MRADCGRSPRHRHANYRSPPTRWGQYQKLQLQFPGWGIPRYGTLMMLEKPSLYRDSASSHSLQGPITANNVHITCTANFLLGQPLERSFYHTLPAKDTWMGKLCGLFSSVQSFSCKVVKYHMGDYGGLLWRYDYEPGDSWTHLQREGFYFNLLFYFCKWHEPQPNPHKWKSKLRYDFYSLVQCFSTGAPQRSTRQSQTTALK